VEGSDTDDDDDDDDDDDAENLYYADEDADVGILPAR